MFRISCFGIRICSILLLALAACFASSASARPLTAAPDGSSTPTTSREHAIVIDVDGIDCVTSYDTDDAPLQICEDSSDPWNDLDEISLPSDDKAVIPSRDDQTTPHFTTTTLDAIAVHQPGIIPAFLLSTHSSFCLCEHLRERAPPA